MQDDIKIIEVNRRPRPNELGEISEQMASELSYLAGIALKKRHAASLIVHCYNPNVIGADISGLSYYCRGESCETLKNGMYAMVQLSAYIESHELYGSDFVEGLITQWGFRDKS